MKKADILIIIISLLTATAIFFFYDQFNTENKNVIVRLEGKIVNEFDLNQDRDYNVSSSYGYNHIHIKDGKVSIDKADCKNQVCVHGGQIDRVGQSIICLPHRLSVEIVGKEELDIDVISH